MLSLQCSRPGLFVTILTVTSFSGHFTSALAEKSLSTTEGVWVGEMPVGGMLGTLNVELIATEAGGLLSFKRHFVSCKYAYAPKDNAHGVYERFLISKTGGKCALGDIRLSAADGNELSLELIGSKFPTVTLRKLAGIKRGAIVPKTVEVLGFTFADKIENLAEKIGAPVSAIGVPRSQTLGMRGRLSQYANVKMTQAEWRLPGERQGIARDIVGAYRFKRDDVTSAIARVWLPEPQDAPTFDATIKALRAKLGKETDHQKSGIYTTILTWHFDEQGMLVRQGAKHACTTRVKTNDTGLILRYLGSDYRLVPGNDVKVMGVSASIRRSTKKKITAFQLKPRLGCGVTVTYSVSKRKNGGLKELSTVAYKHAPFLNAKWDLRKKQVMNEVARFKAIGKTQQSNEPRL